MMITPVIVSTNYKGGVGKTTTSRVLAQAMALDKKFTKGKPLLVIDLDPQGNTSRRWQLLRTNMEDGSSYPVPHPLLEGESPEYSSVCDLWLSLIAKSGLGGLGESMLPVPYETSNPMIHVVPVHETLMSHAISVPMSDRPKLGDALRKWLRSSDVSDTYSCVIIDTQPSKSSLIDAALAAATHAYIPFTPEPQSVDGVYSIISYICLQQQNRGDDVPLTLLGLLPNMVSRTKLHEGHLRALERDEIFGPYMMPVRFARRTGYAETDDFRNTPGQVTDSGNARISIEARKFSKYIIERLAE